MQGEENLFKEYLAKFLYYFIPFAERFLNYLRENVFPYLAEVMNYLQNLSENLPVNFEPYILIFILLIVLGVIFNWKLERREEKKEKKKEISELLLAFS